MTDRGGSGGSGAAGHAMLTVDDVAAVPLFAELPAAELRATRAHVRGPPPRSRRVRGARRRRARAVCRPQRQDRGREDDRRDRTPARLPAAGHDLRRGADRPRDAVSRRLPRRRAVARDADRSAGVLRRRGRLEGHLAEGERAGARADGRAAEHRRRAADAARHGGRPPLGHRLRRRPPVSRPQPDLAHLGDARGAGARGDLARTRAGRLRSAGAAARGRTGARAPRGARPGDSARPADQSARGRSTTSRSSAADRPAWRRPSTARPRACAPSSSSAKPQADRRGRRHESRTISASPAASPATSWRAGRSSRRAASGRRSWSRARSRASIRRRAKCSSTAATSCGRGR